MNMRRQSRLTAEESAVCGITAIARGIREERERGSYKGGMAGKLKKGGRAKRHASWLGRREIPAWEFCRIYSRYSGNYAKAGSAANGIALRG